MKLEDETPQTHLNWPSHISFDYYCIVIVLDVTTWTYQTWSDEAISGLSFGLVHNFILAYCVHAQQCM